MATRTLSAFDIKANWPSAWGASGKLVITHTRSVVSEDGVSYPATANEEGKLTSLGFHWEAAITVASGIGTTASLTGLINTDTATPDHVDTYNVYIYDARGKMREKLNAKPYHIHESLNGNAATFTWEQWVVAMEFVQFRGQNVFVADHATVQSMVDAAANAKAGISPTYGITALSVAPVSASDPIAVGDNDPRLSAAMFNIESYGAVCDGSTDDTVAINAAITAANATGGGTVYIPSSPNGCLVSGSGTQIFLMQKSIKFVGDGPSSQIVVSTGSTATYIFRYNPLVMLQQEGFEMRNFTIRSSNSVQTNYDGFGSTGNWGCGQGDIAGLDECAPGTALALDTTSAASTITPSHIMISGMRFLPLLGRAIVTIHVSPNTAGVPARTTIGPRNLIYNGIQINNGGDTVTIRENEILGRNPGIEVSLISGATTLSIIHNNITADGGIWLKGGSTTRQWNITSNIVEVYKSFGSTSGHNGAIIDVDGTSGTPAFVTIDKNQISSLVDIVLNGIRVNAANQTRISDNTFRTPATTFAVVTTASAANTFFGRMLQEGAGGRISDSDNTSVQEVVLLNAVSLSAAELGAEVITSTNQVYNTGGTMQSNYHAVVGAVSLSGGTATVTFTGAAAFTSTTTFQCMGANASNSNAFKILKVSGSQLTITGTGTDAIMFRCEGN